MKIALSGTYEGQRILLRSEQVTRFALHCHASSLLIVLDRTHKELVLDQQVREQHTEDHSADATAYKSFPSFLRAQFDERCAPKEEAKHIGHNVVAHNHRDGHDGPY